MSPGEATYCLVKTWGMTEPSSGVNSESRVKATHADFDTMLLRNCRVPPDCETMLSSPLPEFWGCARNAQAPRIGW